MNDRQRNRLRMYEPTHTHLLENEGVWNGIPANVDAITTLEMRIGICTLRFGKQNP